MNRSTLVDLTHTFYRDVDANDDTVFGRRLAGEANLTFNDFPPAAGTEAISAMVRQWKSGFASVEHKLENVLADVDHRTTISEVAVVHVFPGGASATVKGCSISEYDPEGLMTSWRVYVDTTRSNSAS